MYLNKEKRISRTGKGFVKPKHRMYLNTIVYNIDLTHVEVKPKHRMYLNTLKD